MAGLGFEHREHSSRPAFLTTMLPVPSCPTRESDKCTATANIKAGGEKHSHHPQKELGSLLGAQSVCDGGGSLALESSRSRRGSVPAPMCCTTAASDPLGLTLLRCVLEMYLVPCKVVGRPKAWCLHGEGAQYIVPVREGPRLPGCSCSPAWEWRRRNESQTWFCCGRRRQALSWPLKGV